MIFADSSVNSQPIVMTFYKLFSIHVATTLKKLVDLTCSKKKVIALYHVYKPIRFVLECHYMSKGLTSDILIKTYG